ncbi:sensor histidine kinase [Paludibaculum fermentans]|uniref:histidine kinase n=1 Tax=Paludibaculum fermentans TaxID=1473598 RepID=A0A7S7NM92_PALFE|nr:ATP-binding protein [Paludibaculum fermentans]QOY86222.1 HAMP domain-containing protein [Paludibaculum fermentans]
MRSIFTKLTLWFLATLALSLLAFFITNRYFTPRVFEPGRMFRSTHRLQLESAVDAYERGGKPELARYMQRVDSLFPGSHYLLDATGHDLLTGRDHSAEVANSGPGMSMIAHSTSDKHYTMLAALMPRPDLMSFLPYYFWIALLVALMAWAFARHFGQPLRALRETVRRFGGGDLTMRARSTRRDELGDLARDFDAMADRIETLLTAERRLLQDVSHELRTPLSRLSLAVQLGRPEQSKQEIARMSALIGELTEMTRAEGDPAAHAREPFDLSGLLTEIAASYDLNLDIQPGLTCHGRPALLRRAVENVLQNAQRYAPAEEKTRLSAAMENGHAVVRIRDFGPGVPEATLEDLFRPFFRVEVHRSRDSGGVGLGLAIAQRAVRLHHGDIVARNANPGLEVTIRFPL